MKIALETVVQLAIAAYHPVDGKLAHTVICPSRATRIQNHLCRRDSARATIITLVNPRL